MTRLLRLLAALVAMAVISSRHAPPAHGDETPDWQAVPDFLQLPAGWSLGACSAVSVNSRGEIYLFHRGQHPILCFDADGRYLRSWGDDLIGSAHGLRIDRDDNIWTTDIGNHRVFKFDAQGKLLLSLGTGKPGEAADQFNKPTDIAFGPRGDLYISDGYGNSRVMRFSPSGALMQSWGTPGKGDGEFRLPHSIVIDRHGRVLVGDRENNRIQIFDGDGKQLDIWNGYAPYGLAFDGAGVLHVADGRANKILRLDDTGKVVSFLGGKGKASGEFTLPHMLSFDKAGHLLVAEVDGKRLQKFVKK